MQVQRQKQRVAVALHQERHVFTRIFQCAAEGGFVVPAALALLLAVVTRRVLLSLGIGIILGAVLLASGNPSNTLLHLKDMAVGLVWTDGGWSLGKLKILIFLLLLGVFGGHAGVCYVVV